MILFVFAIVFVIVALAIHFFFRGADVTMYVDSSVADDFPALKWKDNHTLTSFDEEIFRVAINGSSSFFYQGRPVEVIPYSSYSKCKLANHEPGSCHWSEKSVLTIDDMYWVMDFTNSGMLLYGPYIKN